MKTIGFLMIMLCLNTTIVGDLPFKPVDDVCAGLTKKKAIECKVREVLVKQNLDSFVVELLVAQSKHESGNYTNSLTKYNNLFGRHHHKTDKYSLGAGARAEGHSRFARYATIEDAVLSQLDYLHRKEYSFKWSSAYQYAIELKRKKYYEAPVKVYTNSLNKFLQEVKS
jgi:hypothetical protein